MAENKKSIIVYADWIKKFEELEDDEAGRLIKHFFRYVNDLDPVAPDRITKIAFIDIEQCLKRDLIKWGDSKLQKSRNGSLGNLKRWNADLYDLVLEDKMSIEDAEKIAKDRKLSPSDVPQSKASQAVANIAVSVNDNVSVNVKKNNTSSIVITPVVPTAAINYTKFIETFNSFAGRKFKVTEKLKTSLKARLKDYTRAEIIAAIGKAHKDEHHIETNFKYLTPEFILRPEKLERFINQPEVKPKSYAPQNTN